MLVSGHQHQTVLLGKGGNPDVIFRNWFALGAQVILDAAIMSGSINITAKNGAF